MIKKDQFPIEVVRIEVTTLIRKGQILTPKGFTRIKVSSLLKMNDDRELELRGEILGLSNYHFCQTVKGDPSEYYNVLWQHRRGIRRSYVSNAGSIEEMLKRSHCRKYPIGVPLENPQKIHEQYLEILDKIANSPPVYALKY